VMSGSGAHRKREQREERESEGGVARERAEVVSSRAVFFPH
jgi:hypothetical protein